MLEQDLAATLESDFAAPVVLIAPDGVVISTSLHGGPLLGKVMYDYREERPGGEIVVVKSPLVILRLSSLSRVPKADEPWFVMIPTSPADPTLKRFLIDGRTRAPERVDSIGFVRLFPQAVGQA